MDAAFAQKLPTLPQGTSYDIIQMSPNVIMPFVSYALISKSVSPSDLRQLAQYQIVPLLTGIAGSEASRRAGGADAGGAGLGRSERAARLWADSGRRLQRTVADQQHPGGGAARGQRPALPGDQQQRVHLDRVGARGRAAHRLRRHRAPGRHRQGDHGHRAAVDAGGRQRQAGGDLRRLPAGQRGFALARQGRCSSGSMAS